MTEHGSSKKPADDPAFQLPSSLASLSIPLCLGGLVAVLAGTLLGIMAVDQRFGMSAYLVAFIYCLSISIGCLFFVLIQHLCRAGWSVVVRRVAELMMIMVIPLAILFIPLLVAAVGGDLYAWNIEGYAEDHGVSPQVWAEKERWLNPTWFAIRSVIYLAIWCGLATWYFRRSLEQDETGEISLTERMQARSGPAVIAFAFCTTFAAFDWLMSLAPMWFSTMFGVYVFTGSVLAAHCAITVATFILQKRGAMRDEVTVEHYHDLGKLIFGFICFWGYIAFSQYMLIWYANIPEETIWFYARQTAPWGAVSLVLIFMHWGLPFFGTMSRHVRRRPNLMVFWSIYILAFHYVDLFWVVMPEAGRGIGGAVEILASLLCLFGMVALMAGLILRVAGGSSIVPVRDPRLGESLAFENI